ncbi:MAG: tetratricopeptide repeat protein [Clostridiales bacterium]|jgi:tetratricopeptide (TPR) repeat protein|nr:tetratricopeptide repeat protein [Clostridiales bacterium]
MKEHKMNATSMVEKLIDEADAYGKQGMQYYSMGDFDNALTYYLKALNIYEEVCGIR